MSNHTAWPWCEDCTVPATPRYSRAGTRLTMAWYALLPPEMFQLRSQHAG